MHVLIVFLSKIILLNLITNVLITYTIYHIYIYMIYNMICSALRILILFHKHMYTNIYIYIYTYTLNNISICTHSCNTRCIYDKDTSPLYELELDHFPTYMYCLYIHLTSFNYLYLYIC